MVKEMQKGAKKLSREEIDSALVDNFIKLQRVLTNLSVKFEELSNNISRLLELFEISAKSLVDKGVKTGEVDQEFLKKLDSLLEQNKLISKGIMLMEEKVRNRPTFRNEAGLDHKNFQNVHRNFSE